MNLPDVVTVAIPVSAITAAVPFIVTWAKSLLSKRGRFDPVTPVDLPKRSNQSDAKMRAIVIESAEQIESLHQALGRRNEATGAFVVLELLNGLKDAAVRQTQILAQQTDLLESCEGHLKKLSGESPGRYRG